MKGISPLYMHIPALLVQTKRRKNGQNHQNEFP